MSDLLASFDPAMLGIDFSVTGGDLARDDGVVSAVLISLFTDRRALPTDEIPDGSGNRRGWWGDLLNDDPADRIGSRLWTLDRLKVTPENLRRTQEIAEEALAWMITDKVVTEVNVEAIEIPPRAAGASPTLGLVVTLQRADQPLEFRFNQLWKEDA